MFLPVDKTLHLQNLKTFADDKSNTVQTKNQSLKMREKAFFEVDKIMFYHNVLLSLSFQAFFFFPHRVVKTLGRLVEF